MQNLSYENEYDSHENELVGRTHFHVNGLKQRLVLTQRYEVTQEWLISICIILPCIHYINSFLHLYELAEFVFLIFHHLNNGVMKTPKHQFLSLVFAH